MPKIHLHLANTSIGQILTNQLNSHGETVQDVDQATAKCKWASTSNEDYDSDVDDSNIVLSLKVIFTVLDKKYPDLKYLKYQPIFDQHEIHYATAIQDFLKEFFVKSIEMPEGAVGDFLRNVDAIIKKEWKELKQVKRVCLDNDKENVASA